MTTVSITKEDGRFVITDEETGVTTQGETKLEALLMLADALAVHEDADEDLLATAFDVFIPDSETEDLVTSFGGNENDAPGVPEDQVTRQREAALWLAKSHKKTNYSDPHRFGTLRALIYGKTHGLTFEHLNEFISKGYWTVFDAIATGSRNTDELVTRLDSDRAFVEDAIRELKKHELIAEATDGELYAAQRAVAVGPYVIDEEHIIDWRAHYDHTLASDVPEDE